MFQFCLMQVSETSFEFHHYSRHISEAIRDMGDDSMMSYLKDMVNKYVVVFCDRCEFSVRGKGPVANTVDMFVRHWTVSSSTTNQPSFHGFIAFHVFFEACLP